MRPQHDATAASIDDTIRQLAYPEDEEREFKYMIRNDAPVRTQAIRRKPDCPSLGRLGSLPPELLLMICNFLDFQSLSRASQASLDLNALVHGLSAYHEMMEHAPDVLAVLGKTRLLHHHSASLLRQTLRSDRCVSCFEFGGFLLLPTCERVCLECLHRNPILWMIPITIAKQCFGLSDKDLGQIPVLHSIPDTYCVRFQVSRRRVYRLVNVKQIKQLALRVHGSPEKVLTFLPRVNVGTSATGNLSSLKTLHKASLEPPGRDMSLIRHSDQLGNDHFCGMASMRLPVLTDAGIDRGYLCRGCRVTHDRYRNRTLPPILQAKLDSPGVIPVLPLRAAMTRLHSRHEFLDHAKRCYGARQILAKQRKA
ncbi:hypothetical protein HIM_09735 [Hirsutella minnesotensis 3608]|uniref:F-box domain-containing protein n=1 Tax=Hirsutella minnesotensis 3608 TaxID=1043627 RepID=A0A0F7ZL08_9HYPO|nr:hypothetical protein HIM_09735 [Hirsutella minnesotensis 3608]